MPLHSKLRAAFAAGLVLAGAPCAWAQDSDSPAAAHESGEANDIETKHIFGFTEGTDVGEAGEREMEFETTGLIGKFGGGRYNALEQLATYEVAATARLGYEVSLHGVSQQMANVPGLGNLSQTSFSGVSVMPKWIFLTRGVDAPFGLAASIEPEWDRFDPVSGVRANNVALPVKIYLDAELIARKLYVGANLLYAPEMQKQQGEGFSHYAMAGASAALTYRITPNVAFGGEVEYYEAYNSLGFSNWGGSGTYIGPTFHLQINDKAFVAGAWSVQVASRIPGGAEGLAAYNQSDFSAQRGRLTFAIGF